MSEHPHSHVMPGKSHKLADAVRSIVAVHLEPEIAQVKAAAANRKLAEDSSFGNGSASTATQG
jgi:hypothetical protein